MNSNRERQSGKTSAVPVIHSHRSYQVRNSKKENESNLELTKTMSSVRNNSNLRQLAIEIPSVESIRASRSPENVLSHDLNFFYKDSDKVAHVDRKSSFIKSFKNLQEESIDLIPDDQMFYISGKTLKSNTNTNASMKERLSGSYGFNTDGGVVKLQRKTENSMESMSGPISRTINMPYFNNNQNKSQIYSPGSLKSTRIILKAIFKIQSVWRGFVIRVLNRKRVIDIQKNLRGYLLRKRLSRFGLVYYHIQTKVLALDKLLKTKLMEKLISRLVNINLLNESRRFIKNLSERKSEVEVYTNKEWSRESKHIKVYPELSQESWAWSHFNSEREIKIPESLVISYTPETANTIELIGTGGLTSISPGKKTKVIKTIKKVKKKGVENIEIIDGVSSLPNQSILSPTSEGSKIFNNNDDRISVKPRPMKKTPKPVEIEKRTTSNFLFNKVIFIQKLWRNKFNLFIQKKRISNKDDEIDLESVAILKPRPEPTYITKTIENASDFDIVDENDISPENFESFMEKPHTTPSYIVKQTVSAYVLDKIIFLQRVFRKRFYTTKKKLSVPTVKRIIRPHYSSKKTIIARFVIKRFTPPLYMSKQVVTNTPINNIKYIQKTWRKQKLNKLQRLSEVKEKEAKEILPLKKKILLPYNSTKIVHTNYSSEQISAIQKSWRGRTVKAEFIEQEKEPDNNTDNVTTDDNRKTKLKSLKLKRKSDDLEEVKMLIKKIILPQSFSKDSKNTLISKNSRIIQKRWKDQKNKKANRLSEETTKNKQMIDLINNENFNILANKKASQKFEDINIHENDNFTITEKNKKFEELDIEKSLSQEVQLISDKKPVDIKKIKREAITEYLKKKKETIRPSENNSMQILHSKQQMELTIINNILLELVSAEKKEMEIYKDEFSLITQKLKNIPKLTELSDERYNFNILAKKKKKALEKDKPQAETVKKEKEIKKDPKVKPLISPAVFTKITSNSLQKDNKPNNFDVETLNNLTIKAKVLKEKAKKKKADTKMLIEKGTVLTIENFEVFKDNISEGVNTSIILVTKQMCNSCVCNCAPLCSCTCHEEISEINNIPYPTEQEELRTNTEESLEEIKKKERNIRLKVTRVGGDEEEMDDFDILGKISLSKSSAPRRKLSKLFKKEEKKQKEESLKVIQEVPREDEDSKILEERRRLFKLNEEKKRREKERERELALFRQREEEAERLRRKEKNSNTFVQPNLKGAQNMLRKSILKSVNEHMILRDIVEDPSKIMNSPDTPTNK